MSAAEKIQVVHNSAASRFEAKVQGELCVADYRLHEGVVTFTHTEVPPTLRGHGVAAALVREALAWCAAQGHRVIPACSYVRAYIQRHAELQPLLA
ncbi:MAG TPA: GNAT family N-acetyltransferase [Methylibium sp.]